MATPLPKNQAVFTVADVLAATGGRLVRAARDVDAPCVGVSTDTRAIEPGNLFVALVGERFDGHDHLGVAIEKGARAVLVSRDVAPSLASDLDVSVIVVDGTESALGALGRHHRRRWAHARGGHRRSVVAITGSAGKTTTRHAAASVLASLGHRVFATVGNLNNAIGVPMTLLGLGDEHDVAVVEIGTNHRGEIAHGASIAEPDVAVLTLVAEAHTEGIGSIWDIAREKGDLFVSLRRWGVAIANGDDPRAKAQLPRSPAKAYLSYGEAEDADVRLLERAPEGIRGTRLSMACGGARIEALVPLLGKAGAYASLAAVTVARALDPSVSADALARALSAIPAVDAGRLAMVELVDGTVVVDDAYNANPASMIASIEAASEIARALDRRLVLVLGEMFELGAASAELHARVGRSARATGAPIIAVSGAARAFVEGAGAHARFVPSVAEAETALASLIAAGDVVLVKASNSVGLGAIVTALRKRAKPIEAAPAIVPLVTGAASSRPTSRPAPLGDVETPAAFRARVARSKIVVVGLGKSGVAAARLARRLGAEVVATDAAPLDKLSDGARALASMGVRLAAGGHGGAGLEGADLIVISPGVPPFPELVEAERRGVPVIGELELATHLLADTPSIAITGSNGKSTTTLLVGALLSAAGKRPFVGGNLGDPPCDIVPVSGGPDALAHDVLVLEVSSYQAERAPSFHPRACALLNVSPNHLDRYAGFDDYVRAKGNLFVRQTEADVAVIPAGDALTAREAARGRARVLRFGPASDTSTEIAFTKTEILERTRGRSFPRSSIRLAGEHNALNVCAALGLVSDFDLPLGAVAEVLATFEGLPHRIAFVGEVSGVRYYDDSKGTNVGASVAAIRGLPENKVVLVAGGRDKLGAYDPLVEALVERGRGAVLIGEAADRIASAIGSAVPVVRASSMTEAVLRARDLALAGDAVLLSPACSSFDMFRDYKHRGEAFVEAVRSLAETAADPS